MKTSMPTLTLRVALAALVALTAAGCDLFSIDDAADPNGPSLDGILADPSRENLSALAVGVEATSRIDIHLYLTDVGVIGREYWRISGADPRFATDLLGAGTLDNNTFYITRPWSARYRNIRNANTMLQALELNTTLSDEEKAAGRGWAQTWNAHQYLMNLNLTYDNGVRFIGPGEDAPGAPLASAAALAQIAALLDEGAAALGASGGTFFFPVSSGFGDFRDDPTAPPVLVSGFREVNRALAARVALYQGDYAGALTLLGESFLDPSGDLMRGAYHVFSGGSGDLLNPFFFAPGAAGEVLLAHPDFVDDAEAGDTRVAAKVVDRGEVFPNNFNLLSQFDVFVYQTSTAPIAVIRNAELILIRAEARARTGSLGDAIDDLNIIRNAAGLPDYSGAVTEADVIDEVLRQRRYELYGEGHRWVDVRRLNRLDTLPIDRPGDQVWTQFPLPLAENV